MQRWLSCLLLAFFFGGGGLSLLGCAGAERASGVLAKTPASPPADARRDTAAKTYDFDDDQLSGENLSATGAKEEPAARPQVAFHSAPPGPTKAAAAAVGPSFANQTPHVADLIIYTAVVTMAVYQVEPGLDAVEKIARELGGYLAQRGDKQITVRIPRARFEDALRRVQMSGDVIHRDVTAEDVTDQYVELETRLKNARSMRDRLEQLLARAGVKEAIEIEKELGRVTGDIEAMEGKLKVLKDKIAYSTLTVLFEPRGSSAVRDVPLRLPFEWLGGLGLPKLLSLGEGQ